MENVPQGVKWHGVGPATGYTWQITFKPEFWNWNSNSYTMDYILASNELRFPGGALYTTTDPINFHYTLCPINVFPIIRVVGGLFPGIVENIAPLPSGDPDFWRKPSGRLIPLPTILPLPRP